MDDDLLNRKAYNIAIHASDVESLGKLIHDYPLDYGCRPRPVPQEDGSFVVHAFVTPQEALDDLRQSGYRVEVLAEVDLFSPPGEDMVGQGDRFEGGKVTPRGLGEMIYPDEKRSGSSDQ